MPILETQDLTYVYGAGTPFEKTAVDHISLQIEEGELVGVIGHTGSGKSTFVQQLNGLLKPTSGKVLLKGKDIWAEPKKIRAIRFQVGMVFQYPEHQLFEETVEKDIAFGPKNMGLSEEEIKNISQIYIVACGSAYHVGMAAQYVLEDLARIPVRVELASEFRYRKPLLDKNGLAIIISQSGETADSLAALREAKSKGVRTLGIVNVIGSSIAREADNVFYTLAGPEISVATTKAYPADRFLPAGDPVCESERGDHTGAI